MVVPDAIPSAFSVPVSSATTVLRGRGRVGVSSSASKWNERSRRSPVLRHVPTIASENASPVLIDQPPLVLESHRSRPVTRGRDGLIFELSRVGTVPRAHHVPPDHPQRGA